MIVQFSVFDNPAAEMRDAAPFIVVLQSHHLRPLDSVVVAPVIRDADRPLSQLDVRARFAGEDLVIAVAELAAIDVRHFQRSLGSLAEHEDAIRRALDRIFTGF